MGDAFADVMLESVNSGVEPNFGEVKVPFVWYVNNNEIVVGIRGGEIKHYVAFTSENEDEPNVEEKIEEIVWLIIKDILKGKQ